MTTTIITAAEPTSPVQIYLENVPRVLSELRTGLGIVRDALSDLWPFTWKATADRALDEEMRRSFRDGRNWEREHIDDKIRAAGPAAAAWLEAQA